MIRQIALDILSPKLKTQFPGFQWKWDQLIVRDEKDWVDISGLDPTRAVFYDRCLTQNTKGASVFKRPKTPFKVALVIDSHQMEQCLDFMARKDVRSYMIYFVSFSHYPLGT